MRNKGWGKRGGGGSKDKLKVGKKIGWGKREWGEGVERTDCGSGGRRGLKG